MFSSVYMRGGNELNQTVGTLAELSAALVPVRVAPGPTYHTTIRPKVKKLKVLQTQLGSVSTQTASMTFRIVFGLVSLVASSSKLELLAQSRMFGLTGRF